jgi:aromatic-L-amino-acid decarboxylase
MSRRPPGDMPAEEARRLLHATADWIATFLEKAGELPVFPSLTPGDIAAALPAQAPEQGEEMTTVLADFESQILPGMTHWNHPGFLAYFATTASAPGILGEMLASTMNSQGMLWRTAPAATELEQVVLAWLWQLLGLAGHCFGMIHDTASTSTLHAIAAAREALDDLDVRSRGLSGAPPLVVYCSGQAHSSVDKAAITLGVGHDNVHKIDVDEQLRMKPSALEAAIGADLLAGKRPFCVVATVGTTSTTAVDPVPDIAEICRRRRLWLHVDAAYGGSAAIVPEMRYVLAGCDRADSLVVNPHKWLFVPLDLSAFYCRQPETLRRAFNVVPEVLRSAEETDPRAVNFNEYGVPLGRRFRALKLWFVLRYFGRAGLIANIREHLRLAREFAKRLAEHSDFELMAPVLFSTVCFRFRPGGIGEGPLERLNRSLLDRINRSGKFFLSHTRVREKFTLRLAVGNIRTTQAHLDQAWDLLRITARELTL